MANLLPTPELKKVRWEHRRRIAIVVLAFVMFSMALAILFAVPSAIVVWSASGDYDDQLVATKTLVNLQRKQGGSSAISDLQERIELLEGALSYKTPTSVLQDIVPRIPPGVSVQQIAYAVEEDEVLVDVIGTAQTRNALIIFGDNLRKSELFSQVTVPVSSLAKSEDIDFTLSLSLTRAVSLESHGAAPEATPDEEATAGGDEQEAL